MESVLRDISNTSPDLGAPVIVIQFTTIPFNEIPGDASLDDDRRRPDARTLDLGGTGFIAYDVPGLPKTVGDPSVPVYIWLYGPPTFTMLSTEDDVHIGSLRIEPQTLQPGDLGTATLTLNAPAPAKGVSIPISTSSPDAVEMANTVVVKPGSKIGSFALKVKQGATPGTASVSVGKGSDKASATITIQPMTPRKNYLPLLLIVVGLAVLVWWIFRPVRISVSSGNREVHGATVRRGSQIPVYGPGAKKTAANAFVLNDSIAPSAPADKLATIVLSLIGTPYVKGDLFSVDAAGLTGGRLPLDRTRTFRLKSRSDGSATASMAVKIG
jgi:hypothetical protein